MRAVSNSLVIFLSTLSLRRATKYCLHVAYTSYISIHALLAESDNSFLSYSKNNTCYFYPRSPCGERRRPGTCLPFTVIFLSTLSLRRATKRLRQKLAEAIISIHALLAESDSLHSINSMIHMHFYPRSPCGERPAPGAGEESGMIISIHALLAESDAPPIYNLMIHQNFYPPSPCGERQPWQLAEYFSFDISIHALLAESDGNTTLSPAPAGYFYPRSPCGERRSSKIISSSITAYFYPRSPCGERPGTAQHI